MLPFLYKEIESSNGVGCHILTEAMEIGYDASKLDLSVVLSVIQNTNNSTENKSSAGRHSALECIVAYLRHHPNHSEAVQRLMGSDHERDYLIITTGRSNDFASMRECANVLFEIFESHEYDVRMLRTASVLHSVIDILKIQEEEYVVKALRILVEILGYWVSSGSAESESGKEDLFVQVWSESNWEELFDEIRSENDDPEIHGLMEQICVLNDQLCDM